MDGELVEVPDDHEVDPPYFYPDYVGTRLRAPQPPAARPAADDVGAIGAGLRRGSRGGGRRRPDAQPRRASRWASGSSSAAACSRRTAGRCATPSSRSGRRTPPAATATSVDQHDAPLDPNFDGAGRCLTDDGGPLSLRHDQARRLPVAEPPERLAAGAHPLLDVRTRLHPAARHADVLPRRPALRLRPDLQLDPRPEGARAPDLARSTCETTTPGAGRSDSVRHRASAAVEATPFEEDE